MIPRQRLAALLRRAIACAALLAAANACFLLVRLAEAAMPRTEVRAAISRALATGALGTDPYPVPLMRGRDNYSDCMTLQVAAVGGAGLLRDALAPRVLAREQVGRDLRPLAHNPCANLDRYLAGTLQPEAGATYERFWHGAASALTFAMLVLPLEGYRAALVDWVLGLIAAAAVCAALRDRRLLVALLPWLVASFAFDGQLGYGQLVSHAPAHVAAWSIAVVMIARGDRLSESGFLSLAVLAGALEAFLDQMISVPLTAAIFLVVAATVLEHRNDERRRDARAWRATLGLAAAWWFGLFGTYAIKLALSLAALGPGAVTDFLQQLAFRAGTADATYGFEPGLSRAVAVGQVLYRMSFNIWRLGYTDAAGIYQYMAVLLLAAVGWLTAAGFWLVATQRGRRPGAVGVGYILAALVTLAWVFVFPEHAYRHTFTIRATIIWIVGGWGALCVMALARRLPARASRHSAATIEPMIEARPGLAAATHVPAQ